MRARRLVTLVVVMVSAAVPAGCHSRPGDARVRIGRAEWKVEIAADEASRRRGLGGRREVPAGTGMLFVFPREAPRRFHMLDCYVPLDVAFISSRGVIVDIRTMVVEPDPAHPATIYSSRRPARYALEVPAGELAAAGVKVGDRVELLGAARDAAKAAR